MNNENKQEKIRNEKKSEINGERDKSTGKREKWEMYEKRNICQKREKNGKSEKWELWEMRNAWNEKCKKWEM
mgnify:CR=1 FL=1